MVSRDLYQGHLRDKDIPMTDPNTTRPDLPPEAQRALQEAAERRAKSHGHDGTPAERGGPTGPEPVRYGDWERKGIAVDF